MLNIRKLFCLFKPKELMLSASIGSNDSLVKFTKNFNEPLLVEGKYDGMRVQIHFNKSLQRTKIYSRSSEDQKDMIPDLIQLSNKALMESEYQQCILDGELMSVQNKTGKYLSFSNLMCRRGKKRSQQDFNREDVKQQFLIFDILQKNGKSLEGIPLIERKKELLSLPLPFRKVSYVRISSQSQIKKEFQLSRDLKLEGLILKKESSIYKGNSRTCWAKLKQDLFQQGKSQALKDLDLVVIGGYFGKGKNSALLSSFLLGVPFQNKIISVCKVGTGFNNQFLRQITRRAMAENLNQKIEDSYDGYKSPLIVKPDKFLKPYCIWKIKYQEPSLSATYKLGKALSPNKKGLSLRFPVFVAERPDLAIKDIKTGQQIISDYQNLIKEI